MADATMKVHVTATPEFKALLRRVSREASAGALEAAARAFDGGIRKRWTNAEIVSLLRQMAAVERSGGSRDPVPMNSEPPTPAPPQGNERKETT